VRENVEGRVWESEYSANTENMYVNRKIRPVETIPGMGGRRKMEEFEFEYDIFDIL
jgi:hypothetical protein